MVFFGSFFLRKFWLVNLLAEFSKSLQDTARIQAVKNVKFDQLSMQMRDEADLLCHLSCCFGDELVSWFIENGWIEDSQSWTEREQAVMIGQKLVDEKFLFPIKQG